MTQPQPAPAGPPPTWRRLTRNYRVRVLAAVIAAVPLLWIAGQLGWLDTYQQETPRAAGAGEIGAGTWLVGAHIQPGVYRSAGADPGRVDFCHWRRLSDTSGENRAILAQGTGNAGEQQLVTIMATDVAFEASGCEPFTRIG